MVETIKYLKKLYEDAVDNGIPVWDKVTGAVANVAGIALVIILVKEGFR